MSPFPWLLICLVLLNASHLHGITVTGFSLTIYLEQSQGHCFLLSTLQTFGVADRHDKHSLLLAFVTFMRLFSHLPPCSPFYSCPKHCS